VTAWRNCNKLCSHEGFDARHRDTGHADPVSVRVETVNPVVSEAKIIEALRQVFDMRPAAIAERLNLLQPIYANTAAYGHFGRPEFPWEQPDRVAQLQDAVK
jgi:S-adenosylmethionine synthetase